jgi:asparagine synthetase B (glutamine-hydrolysing)
MKILLNYNFNIADLDFFSNNFENLFGIRRRDSCFAFVYENEENIYAIRDHFGQIPLYYRIYSNGNIKFSLSLIDLLNSECRFNYEGLRHYLSFATSRIITPFQEIQVVPAGSVVKINKKTKKSI